MVIRLYLVVECILRMLISKEIANRDYSNAAGIDKKIPDLWLVIRNKKKNIPKYVSSGLEILAAIENERKEDVVSLFEKFTKNVQAESLKHSFVYNKLLHDLGDEVCNAELLYAKKAQLKLGIVDLLAANEEIFGLNKLRGEAERIGFIEKDGDLSQTLKSIASSRHDAGHSLWASTDKCKLQEYMKDVKSATDELIPKLEDIINPSDVSFYFKHTILRHILLILFICCLFSLRVYLFCFLAYLWEVGITDLNRLKCCFTTFYLHIIFYLFVYIG